MRSSLPDDLVTKWFPEQDSQKLLGFERRPIHISVLLPWQVHHGRILQPPSVLWRTLCRDAPLFCYLCVTHLPFTSALTRFYPVYTGGATLFGGFVK